MKLSELRQIIKEELEETLNVLEMGRAATQRYILSPDWRNKVPKGTKEYVKLEKLTANAKPGEEIIVFPSQIWSGGYASYDVRDPNTGEVVKTIPGAAERWVMKGILTKVEGDEKFILDKTTGQYNPYTPTTKTSSGIKGRPKVIDASKKMIGANIINKYSKGSIDFSPEEIEFIETLYKAVKA